MFRDLILFLAGAEFFHTLTHIAIAYSIRLPLATEYVVLTPFMNTWAIVINGIITIGLLVWAFKLKRR